MTNTVLPLPRVSLLLADPAHADTIAALHEDAFDEGWSRDMIERLLSAQTAIAFVATLDQGHQPAGFVIGRLAGADAEIVTLGVCRAHRRKGIGMALVGAFERMSVTAGAERAIFEVAVDNTPALALYCGLGFADVGLRKNYYQRSDGQRVDARILAKPIPISGAQS